METAPTSDHNHSPPRTVRTNWLRYSWNQISSSSKLLLVVSFIVAIVQIATTATVLAIGSKRELSCDKPFQLYLIILVVRVGVSLPLSVYQLLFTPRGRRGVGQPPNQNGRRTRQPSTQSNSEQAESSTNTHISQEANEEQHSYEGSHNLVTGWVDKLKSLLDLFAILWFIVGNYLLFSPSDCLRHADLYYYTVLTWVLFGYMILLVPLLACASIVFCLPCVLVALRAFNINIANIMMGGSKEEIAKIPVFRYKRAEPAQETEEAQAHSLANDHTNKSIKSVVSSKRHNWIRQFMQRHHKSKSTQDQQTYQYLTLPQSEDAVCSICLCEYENEEFVCKLWCNHQYHKDCVHEWLGLNSKCPLCKRDFRGKDYVDEEGSDEEP
ncbi:hypothetical protein BD560DRAFT_413009 [Blakeslea trispora]|nr:hypothetical protein BD560DRAFT_413009 [Blakeslea trispora]